VKTGSVIMVSFFALVCGFIAGQGYTESLDFKHAELSRQLAVSQFATQIRQDATTLALIKRNRLECAQTHLERQVKAMLDVAGSYSSVAATSEKAMLEKAVDFGTEQLRVPHLVGAGDPKSCGT
jgi:hypothetical protein